MLVGDLVYNDAFDLNCNYDIYDCTSCGTWSNGGKVVFSTKADGLKKPLSYILDMQIKYITVSDGCVKIEATA